MVRAFVIFLTAPLKQYHVIQFVAQGMGRNRTETDMPHNQFEDLFLTTVEAAPALDSVRAIAAKLKAAKKKATTEDRAQFTAMLANAAFLAPDRVAEIYDAATEGWEGRPINSAPINSEPTPSLKAPSELWPAYFDLVRDAAAGALDALSITSRTADLGGMMSDAFNQRLIQASYAYPGVRTAAERPLPDMITLDTLAAEPEGSLARQFHDLIVANKFDLEVLDRDEIGLHTLPKPLDYLNTRMLQAHDLWHIVAGYDTTALHEIALSAFQMAQFGHNYSAHFLAVVFGAASSGPASGFVVAADTVFSAWRHGRETAPFLLIDWESEWGRSADDIRHAFEITPYQSPYRADLIERTAPLVKLIHTITAPFSFASRVLRRAEL